MKIKAILEAIHSKRDRYGNTYWAMRYTDTETGRVVVTKDIGGESNFRYVGHALGLSFDEVVFTVTELPIRQWDRLVKDWPYLGNGPYDVADKIKAS